MPELKITDADEDVGMDIDSAFGARPGWKSSQGGANSRVSYPVYQDLKTRSKEPSGAASQKEERKGVCFVSQARRTCAKLKMVRSMDKVPVVERRCAKPK